MKVTILILVSLYFTAGKLLAVEKIEKPNILFILTDDQSYNTIRALGNHQIHTPNMDELVKGGTTFSHAYNMGAWHGAVCVASRTMLLTGMSVWEAKAKEAKLDSLIRTNSFWSQLLSDAGYMTYMTGKWHIHADVAQVFDYVGHLRPGMASDVPAGYNRPQSIDDHAWVPWDTANGGYWTGGKHWSETQADDAEWFINKAGKEKSPFFMYLAFNAPHDPRQSPRAYIDMYPLDAIEVPENYLPVYPLKDKIGCGDNLRDEKLAPWPRTHLGIKRHLQEYYALISHLDTQIGRVVQALKDVGAYENTIIILTSDHGLAIGSHGLMGKQNMFDHSLRVPLIIRGPGIPEGIVNQQQVYLQDIMPTTLQLAGIEKPKHVFYNSFLEILKGKSSSAVYDEIYGCYMDLQRMVRTDKYKLIVYPKANKILLYDLRNDPLELTDLSEKKEYQEVLDDLKSRLLKQQLLLNDKLVVL